MSIKKEKCFLCQDERSLSKQFKQMVCRSCGVVRSYARNHPELLVKALEEDGPKTLFVPFGINQKELAGKFEAVSGILNEVGCILGTRIGGDIRERAKEVREKELRLEGELRVWQEEEQGRQVEVDRLKKKLALVQAELSVAKFSVCSLKFAERIRAASSKFTTQFTDTCGCDSVLVADLADLHDRLEVAFRTRSKFKMEKSDLAILRGEKRTRKNVRICPTEERQCRECLSKRKIMSDS